MCQIASSCDRILHLNFPSDHVSDDRKWAGSISWCNCIFSISLDDDLHLQVLLMLRDTAFRWSHCNVEKFIYRYGSSSLSLSSLKVRSSMKVMICPKLIFADHKVRFTWFVIVIVIPRDKYVTYLSITIFVFSKNTRSTYQIFENIIFKSSSSKISTHWWSFKIYSRSFTYPSSSEECPLSFCQCVYRTKWHLFVESNYSNCFSCFFIKHLYNQFDRSSSIVVLIIGNSIIISMKVSFVIFPCFFISNHWA